MRVTGNIFCVKTSLFFHYYFIILSLLITQRKSSQIKRPGRPKIQLWGAPLRSHEAADSVKDASNSADVQQCPEQNVLIPLTTLNEIRGHITRLSNSKLLILFIFYLIQIYATF